MVANLRLAILRHCVASIRRSRQTLPTPTLKIARGQLVATCYQTSVLRPPCCRIPIATARPRSRRIARSCYRYFEPNLMPTVKKVATHDRMADLAHRTQIQPRLQSREEQRIDVHATLSTKEGKGYFSFTTIFCRFPLLTITK
jgi:hypothetical protein